MENFSFTYAGAREKALTDIDLSIGAGEFVLLFGASGSGKTTLLSNLKREIAPKGERTGSIFLDGVPLTEAESAAIGYVSQSPENQLVADTVRRELAFGPENMGVPYQTVRRRVAELSCYFGLNALLEQKTDALSGGQKQLVNLAAALCPAPSVLLLDEPVAQLDPVAAEQFLSALFRLNRELGLTVLLCEHFTENIVNLCDRVVFLEGGRIAFNGCGEDFVRFVLSERPQFADAMPAVSRLSFAVAPDEPLPLDLGSPSCRKLPPPPAEKSAERPRGESVLRARELWYAYERSRTPALCGASFELIKGEIHAVVGGNGAGKSTLFSVLAGAKKGARGSVKKAKGSRTALLPQEPRLLFCEQTVFADLMEFSSLFRYTEDTVRRMLCRFDLSAQAERHPYDLSAGETQRAALAKLLLAGADVLLLDEPVKGMDSADKAKTAALFRSLASEGRTVAFITHDLDFAAFCADRVTMLSGGVAICCETASDFFSGNFFFTTSRARLTRCLERYARAERGKTNADG